MPALQFKLEPPILPLEQEFFDILCDFLQPRSSRSCQATAKAILALLPADDAYSVDMSEFADICIGVAEQTPYHHPSQIKLVRLLTTLGESIKFKQDFPSEGTYISFQRLIEALRDNFIGPELGNEGEYVNFHAFSARLAEYQILRNPLLWAISLHREAFEEKREEARSLHDATISAATQWILCFGQGLFEVVLSPGDASAEELRSWTPGPLYTGSAQLTLGRWHFWRDCYRTVAAADKGDGGSAEETKRLAARAADMMDALESNMKF